MRLPSFRKIALSIPFTMACGIGAGLERARRDLGKLYVALGGSSTAECCRSQRIGDLRDEIRRMLAAEIDRTFTELYSDNPGLKNHQEEYGLSVHSSIRHDFFNGETQSPTITIALEVAVVFTLFCDFLARLKDERPRIYPLMRSIVRLLDIIAPRTTVPDRCEIFRDNIEVAGMEDDQVDPGDETANMLSAEEEECAQYEKHVLSVKCGTTKQLLKKIRLMHRKTSWELTEQENWFVLTAIQLFESWSRWNWDNVDILQDDYYADNQHDMQSFFNLMWNEGGALSDDLEQWLQYSGELSAPRIIFNVPDKKHLQGVMEVIRSFTLLEATMGGGYTIWNVRH